MNSTGQNSSHRADLTDLIQSTPIDALAILQDLLTHQLLGQSLEAVVQQFRTAGYGLTHGVVFLEGCDRFSCIRFHGFETVITLLFTLLKLAEHSTDCFGALLFEISRNSVVFFGRFRLDLLNAKVLQQCFLGFDEFLDGFIAEINRLNDVSFGELVGACLNHHHTIRCASDDEV